MGIHVEVKRKITVDGREYESLDQVPDELRNAVQTALASGATPKATIRINGKTYGSLEEMPPGLRAIATVLTSLAASRMLPSDPSAEALSPEPVLSMRKIVVVILLAAGLVWLLRLFR